MIRWLLALVLLVAAPAWAQTTIYVSKCGPQAAPGCVAGSNANPGTSASAPKLDFVGQIDLGTIAAGSTVRLACGGHWEDPGQWYVERLTTMDVKIEPYQHEGGPVCNITPVVALVNGGLNKNPSFSTSDTRPRLTYSTDTSAIYCQGNSCNGMWVDGLRMVSTGSTSLPGVFMAEGSSNFRMSRLDISGFVIPFYPFANTTVGSALHRFMVVEDNRFHGGVHGFHGGFSESLFQRNLMERNNQNTSVGSGSQHGFYMACPSNECPGNLIRWNVLLNNSINTTTGNPESGRCNGGNFTYRGRITENVIERNTLINDVGGTTVNCYGFSLGAGYFENPTQPHATEYFRRSVLRDNSVHGISNGYAITTATNMLLDGNVYVASAAMAGDSTYGFQTPHRSLDSINGDDLDSGITIRNGTCVFEASPAFGSACVYTQDNSGATMGTGVTLSNIHAHFVANTASTYAWNIKDTPASYARIQGLAVTGSNRLWHPSYSSLASFNTRFNALPSGAVAGAVDAASADFATTPSSSTGYTCTLNSGSPLVDAGNTAGRARMSNGLARVNSTDIGACVDR